MRSNPSAAELAELEVVGGLADQLAAHLEEEAGEIDKVHLHGAPSSAVQAIVARLLTERLGFAQEVILEPQEGFCTRARPDFIFHTGAGRGILA